MLQKAKMYVAYVHLYYFAIDGIFVITYEI